MKPVIVGHFEPQRQPIGDVDHVLILDGMRAQIRSHPVVDAGEIGSGIVHGVGVCFRSGTAGSPIAVAERAERFAQPLRRRVETVITEQPGVAPGFAASPTGEHASQTEIQFTQIGNHEIGACRPEPLADTCAVHADDQSESASCRCLQSGFGIFHDYGPGRCHTQLPRRFEKYGRIGFAGQTQPDRISSIDTDVRKIGHGRRREHRGAVSARRHDSGGNALLAKSVEQRDRVWESQHAVGGEMLVEERLFARSEGGDRLLRARIIGRAAGRAVGQLNAARRQEGTDAVFPGPPIDVPPIVGVRIEWLHRSGRQPRKHLVEQGLPRARMHGRGIGDHAVHVEDHGVVRRSRRMQGLVLAHGYTPTALSYPRTIEVKAPSSLVTIARQRRRFVGWSVSSRIGFSPVRR